MSYITKQEVKDIQYALYLTSSVLRARVALLALQGKYVTKRDYDLYQRIQELPKKVSLLYWESEE